MTVPNCPSAKGMLIETCIKRQKAVMSASGHIRTPQYLMCAQECEIGRQVALNHPEISGQRKSKRGRPRIKNIGLCKAPHCQKAAHTKGMCQFHYNKSKKKTGNRVADTRCSVEGCRNMPKAKGKCMHHYMLEYDREHKRIPMSAIEMGILKKLQATEAGKL